MGGRREQCLVLGATSTLPCAICNVLLTSLAGPLCSSSSVPHHTCGCRSPESDDPVMNCALARRFVLLLSLALYACSGTVTTSNFPPLISRFCSQLHYLLITQTALRHHPLTAFIR